MAIQVLIIILHPNHASVVWHDVVSTSPDCETHSCFTTSLSLAFLRASYLVQIASSYSSFLATT